MWKNNFIIGIFMMLLLGVLFFFLRDFNAPFLPYILAWLIIGVFYMSLASGINKSLNALLPWENNFKKRLKYNIIAYLIIMFFGSVLISYLESIAFSKPMSIQEYLLSSNGKLKVFAYYFNSLFITFFFHAKGFYEELLKVQMKEQALIEAKNKSEINNLKNQLNPHFLFNNLSVLHSLIEEDPKLAQDFTEKITTNYRDVMNAQQKEMNSIEDELKIVENYLELLNIRLGNVIQLHIDSGLIQEKTILPLSLQMAIENAVKHNIATSEDPLNIHIYPEQEYVVVENSLLPKKALNSNKMGLENLRKRYNLYLKTLQIEKTPTQFIMKIPYLT